MGKQRNYTEMLPLPLGKWGKSIARHANLSSTQCYIDVNDAMKRKAVELV